MAEILRTADARAALSELVTDLESGGRPADGACASGVLSVGGEHIGADGSFLMDNKCFVPEVYYDDMRRGKLQRDDILIVKDGATTGKVGFVDSALRLPAAINEHVFRLKVDETEAVARYVFYYLLSPWGNREILLDFRGATVGGISQDFPERVRVPLPDLPIQRRIAGILDKADRLRRMRRYELELSDQFLPALFLRMFGDPVRNDRRHDLVELGDELDNIDSGFSPVCGEPRPSPSEWAILGLGAVTTGFFLPDENKVLLPGVQPRPELEVRDRDVLITRKNTTDLVAACVLVRRPPPRLLLPDTIFRFRLREDSQFTPEFLWGLFTFPAFRRAVQSLATGSAGSMPNISKEKFRDVRCPVPPRPLVERFSSAVAKSMRENDRHREALRRAEHLFQSLLNQYFGEEN